MLLVSPPPCIRRSIRLKVKGLQGSSKVKAQLALGSALLAQFPFGRLTNDEVADLFRTYRVKLGSNIEQRDAIIQNIRNMQRDSFNSVMEHLIARSKSNTFEMVTVVFMDSPQGTLDIQ
jgi:hypothetical protein